MDIAVGDMAWQLNSEASLLPIRPLRQRIIVRHIDRLNKLRSETFNRSFAREVVRRAGDPKLGHAVLKRQRQQQPAGALGITIAAEWRLDAVPDVAGVETD